MTEIPTIEEFEDLVDGYANACFTGSGDEEDYRADILSAYDAQAARIAELEEVLCAFAPNNIKPGHWARSLGLLGDEGYPMWKCRHCDARADEWQRIEHGGDCPVVLAIALLPKEATDIGDRL